MSYHKVQFIIKTNNIHISISNYEPEKNLKNIKRVYSKIILKKEVIQESNKEIHTGLPKFEAGKNIR